MPGLGDELPGEVYQIRYELRADLGSHEHLKHSEDLDIPL